jgi:hypothetical protein
VPPREENFWRGVKDSTAGDPRRPDVNWTNRTWGQSAEWRAEAGPPVRVTVVKQRLRNHRALTRKARQSRARGQQADRNRQVATIARLTPEDLETANPLLSLDPTTKEWVGNFSRAGRLSPQETSATCDHDFPRAGSGVILPHGLDDVTRNDGPVNLGTSPDPSAFAGDRIEWWWESRGRTLSRRAPSIRRLGDGGGSTSANQDWFKEDLQRRVARIGIAIRRAPCPPSASQSNPIEPRLFPP